MVQATAAPEPVVTAPKRSGGATPAGPSAVLRGAVLVAIAVVLGLALLAKGFPESGGKPSGSSDGETTTTAGDSTTSSTAAALPHQPAEVKILVLNGSGLVGVAGQATDILNGKGYTTIPPANAPAKVPATVVYYTEGYQADAEAIAAALGTGAHGGSAAAARRNPPCGARRRAGVQRRRRARPRLQGGLGPTPIPASRRTL